MISTSLGFAGGFSLMWKFGLSGAIAILALLISCYYYAQRRSRSAFSSRSAWLGPIYSMDSVLNWWSISSLRCSFCLCSNTDGGAAYNRGQSAFRMMVLLVLVGGAAYASECSNPIRSENGPLRRISFIQV